MNTRKRIQKVEDTSPCLERRIGSLKALYIVYDADGTVPGEVLYLLRKWFGRGHCAACDITHGDKKVKPEWTTLQTTGWLGVPLFNIHRDEMDAKLRTVVNTALPCVAGETDDSQYFLLLRPDDLESCVGDLSKLQEKIIEALQRCSFEVSWYQADKGKDAHVEASPVEAENRRFEQDAVVPAKSGDTSS
ncbi:hypothetical protein Gasu2_27180 [Galdieria sulphuraria]|uniref:Uncharacterized protein n=1 Tax=Galdieria sulphuraria TaxID=130081 RepID=M2XJF4_GALSU|nr:uncharacterized protein Gasu_24000 [Galdieria sulphuraria]EME30247.1 hypothetical protein Gasu_24000 [Galdieria sulphuraria]GJD08414.1 hypothetical protein Gasu2_27180 [Galdieria sulphuraria]|eukprot:XP_005706767.1 hypothetical protein Gasu_24000 [Galdieria sulphuraria]